jgi:BASS family bile acid:Na+ symporter
MHNSSGRRNGTSCQLLVGSLSHFIHRHFLWLLIGSYAVAALCPAFGLWIRSVSFGQIGFLYQDTKLTLPMLMLACLLLNAGLGVETSELGKLLRSPLVLLTGLAANLLIPVALICGINEGMRFWHNPDEVQNLLVGLALIASMPIAGSSTAWSQNANGNLALSLGLVVSSTLLSPLTTPLSLQWASLMTTGEYAQALRELAAYGSGGFLVLSVLVPSLLGISLSRAVGETRIASARPATKLANSVNLLLLNYSNASVALPHTVADPDWDFLAVILASVAVMCIFSFATGWLVSRLLRTDAAQRTSLMFGLGLNNNGTGLVLASMALSGHPRMMLPVILYNLIQHLVAGAVDALGLSSQRGQSCSRPQPLRRKARQRRRRLLMGQQDQAGGLLPAKIRTPK